LSSSRLQTFSSACFHNALVFSLVHKSAAFEALTFVPYGSERPSFSVGNTYHTQWFSFLLQRSSSRSTPGNSISCWRSNSMYDGSAPSPDLLRWNLRWSMPSTDRERSTTFKPFSGGTVHGLENTVVLRGAEISTNLLPKGMLALCCCSALGLLADVSPGDFHGCQDDSSVFQLNASNRAHTSAIHWGASLLSFQNLMKYSSRP